jgi:peptide/nickel transport system permease protein
MLHDPCCGWYVNRSLIIALTLLCAVLLFALFGDQRTEHSYDKSNLLNRNKAPVFVDGSWDYPLGTDRLGRDMVARLVYGTRVSIGLAFLGTVIGLLLGTVLGLLAARAHALADSLIMALVDLQAAIPFMIIALVTLAIFGSSLMLFLMILGVYGWESYARLVRNNALSAHTLPFVDAARVTGVSAATIDRRHILPTVVNVIIVQATLNFPKTILLESGLSFLGLGIQSPMTSLGQLLGDGRDSLSRAWWIAVMPGFLIFITTLSVCLLGDALRDRLDPSMQRH